MPVLTEETTAAAQTFSNRGVHLDAQAVDELRDSSPLRDDITALRRRMQQDGYLFMRGLLTRDEVLEARREITRRMAEQGWLDPASPAIEAIAARARDASKFVPDILAKDNAALAKVLYAGPLMDFFQDFFDQPVRHFDYTWLRSIWPGPANPSHCDIVYMGRGERERLFTAWTPLGDIDCELGGLAILEGSHHNQRLKETYGQMDVDGYCVNKPDARGWGKVWGTGGHLKGHPDQIRRAVGGRWLTASYRAGDVVIFGMFTVHMGLDNHSPNRIRLSSDSRYQPADTPADERWIGPNPIAHGAAGRRGRIC